MKDEFGLLLKDFPVGESSTINDLIYYDGPILSHIKDSDDNNYLIQWVDQTDSFDRWLLFDVSEKNLFDFLLQKADLKSLLDKNKYVYLIDTDESEEIYKKVVLVRLKELPDRYTIKENYYFKLTIPESLEYLIDKYASESFRLLDSFTILKQNILEETIIGYFNRFSQRGSIFSFQS